MKKETTAADLLDAIEYLILWMRQAPLDANAEAQQALDEMEALRQRVKGLVAGDVPVARPSGAAGVMAEPYKQTVLVGC